MTDTSHHTRRKPWSLWILSLIITLIGVYNLLLALDNSWHAERYREWGVSYPPVYRAVMAALWGVSWVSMGMRMGRRQRHARRRFMILASAYGAFGVLWLSVFARSDYSQGRIAFQAALTAGAIALAGWTLRWRRIREPFGS